MNWERIQAAATPMELAPRLDELPDRRPITLRTVLTVAMVVPYLWLAPPWAEATPLRTSAVPEVVQAMPFSMMIPGYRPMMAEDCRAQQEAGWFARCEGLAP